MSPPPSLNLTCNSPYSDRNGQLSFSLDVSLGNLVQSDILSVVLVVNDETLTVPTQYISLPIPASNATGGIGAFDVAGYANIVKVVTGLTNGHEYTARALLETNTSLLVKSNTVKNVMPFTTPDKPSFSRYDDNNGVDAVDSGFSLKLNLDNYATGGSPLTKVKFIWSRVDAAGDGSIDFQTFSDLVGNNFVIDLSNSMVGSDLLNDAVYEVSCVVRNLAGESIVSDSQQLNCKNVPANPTGITVVMDSTNSSENNLQANVGWVLPSDYSVNIAGSDAYKHLTYRVFYDSCFATVGTNGQYVDVSEALLGALNNGATSALIGFDNVASYNQTLYYAVKAINKNGSSVLSNKSSGLVPYARTSAPTIQNVYVGPLDSNYGVASDSAHATLTSGNGTVYVRFVPPTQKTLGATTFMRYELYDSSTNVVYGHEDSSVATIITTSNSLLQNNVTYDNLAIRAVTVHNGTTLNGYSAPIGPVTPFTFLPTLTISSHDDGDSSTTVNWNPITSLYPGSVTNYKIVLENVTSNNINDTRILNTTDSTHSFTGLANGSTYKVTVTPYVSINDNVYYGEGAYTNCFPVGVPSLPANFSFKALAGPLKADYSPASTSLDACLNVTDGTNGDDSVTFVWSDLSGYFSDALSGAYSAWAIQILDACNNTIVKELKYGVDPSNSKRAVLKHTDASGANVLNGVSRSYKLRLALTKTGVNAVVYSNPSDGGIARPFSFPNAVTLSSIIPVTHNLYNTVSWTDVSWQYGYPSSYVIDSSNGDMLPSSITTTAYSNVTINWPSNGLHYVRIKTKITANGNDYYSNAVPFEAYSYADLPQPVATFTESDNAINIIFDSSLNHNAVHNSSLRDLAKYRIILTVTDSSAAITGVALGASYELLVDSVNGSNAQTVTFNLGNTGIVKNGVAYSAKITSLYNMNGTNGIINSLETTDVLKTLSNIRPYGLPISNFTLSDVSFNGGLVNLVVNPNGRTLSQLLLVGIPVKPDASWNYVYNVSALNTITTSGNYGFAVANPFVLKAGNAIESVFVYVANAAGTISHHYNNTAAGSMAGPN